MTTEVSISIMQRHMLTVEKLRASVRQMLKCVINLHIEILVLESNVTQLLEEVKDFNAELLEEKRLDALIETLRNYSGPTICHEWPYPLMFKGNTIDDADIAQVLNPIQPNPQQITAATSTKNANTNKTEKLTTT